MCVPLDSIALTHMLHGFWCVGSPPTRPEDRDTLERMERIL